MNWTAFWLTPLMLIGALWALGILRVRAKVSVTDDWWSKSLWQKIKNIRVSINRPD